MFISVVSHFFSFLVLHLYPMERKKRAGAGDNPMGRKKGYVTDNGWVELNENLPQIFSFQMFFFIAI